jgi:hypothetical protein
VRGPQGPSGVVDASLCYIAHVQAELTRSGSPEEETLTLSGEYTLGCNVPGDLLMSYGHPSAGQEVQYLVTRDTGLQVKRGDVGIIKQANTKPWFQDGFQPEIHTGYRTTAPEVDFFYGKPLRGVTYSVNMEIENIGQLDFNERYFLNDSNFYAICCFAN